MDFTMQDARFGALVAFAAVAEERSFTRAARRLQVSPSAVSQSVRRLETRLGLVLLSRTSRKVEVTDAGARFLARAAPALGELASTFESASREGSAVAGTLRITAPTLASAILPPIIGRFLSNNPDANVFVSVDDHKVDLVEQRFDAGVRLEEAIAPDMVAVRIARPFRFVIVGAPAYLRARGTPQKLADLAHHETIAYRLPTSDALYRWELERRGRVVRPELRGRLVTNGIRFGLEAARACMGLAYVDEPSAARFIERGDLAIVLERYAAHVPGLYLYYPSASKRAPRIRALVQAVRDSDRR